MTSYEFIKWLRGYLDRDETLDKKRVDRIREYLRRIDESR